MAVEDGSIHIKLDEEIDGDEFGSRNFRFSKIGEPVPLLDSEFDPQSLPSQPLTVSERFRLLFVAHSNGFCVMRTKDVILAAEEIKEKGNGPSVKELSLVDVPIGKVSILAISVDDSFLAATVGSHVHFFAVSALLHKEQKPSYSVSVDDSSCINDMRWARKDAKVYLVLAENGHLYSGSGQGPLKCVMENVDAVDWSVKGNFVAVAKKNTLSILSWQFKETLSFLLPFHSECGDSDVNQVIKVDSIRWVRQDCVAVGCFQLNEDGEEENYIVQVITSRDGGITNAASKPIVLSFNNIFMDFCSDAVPARSGPHMFLSYLDHLGLAFIANKNLSQHVGLFYWSLDNGKDKAAMVEILNDAWTLHIDSQDNGEENVILGLSVDKVAQNENVKFTLGDEETEVSPCCTVICLTIDGKVSVFHFASAIGASVPREGSASDEEDAAVKASMKNGLAQNSSGDDEKSGERVLLKSDFHGLSSTGIGKTGAKATFTNVLPPPSFHVNVRSKEISATRNMEQKPPVNSQKLEVEESKKSFTIMPIRDSNAENQSVSEVKSRPSFFPGKVIGDVSSQSMGNNQLAVSNVESLGNVPSKNSPSGWSLTQSIGRVDASKASSGRFLSDEVSNVESLGNVPSKNSPSGWSLTQSIGRVDASKASAGRFLSDEVSNVESLSNVPSKNSPSGWSLTQSIGRVDASKASAGRFLSDEVGNFDKRALQSTGGLLQGPTDPNYKSKQLAMFASAEQTELTAQGNRHSVPSYPVPQVPLEDSAPSGKSSKFDFRKGSTATSSPTGLSLKHFGNVEEMAKKLDTLLEGIEGKGGFVDACITSQENFVIELEKGILALSDRCRMWKGLQDDQLREVQLLLDKTIQVLARKLYLEGIFTQATDSRYWELWNRQKLSSELELKRKRLLDFNQELTNQLVELERHFNSLEFNKFGDNGMQRNQRSSQGFHGRSRQIQSLHSLHNTMTAQLVAAEQLSECLSRQMAVLSIESSGKQDAKRKLFESIGLSYAADSQRSLGRGSTFSTPPNKEQLTTSCSVAIKGQPRRNQDSIGKSCEPETARRRRDSLDLSWASLEPPKTTVNRMLLEGHFEKGDANRSLLKIDSQYRTPQSLKISEVANSAQKESEVANSERLNISGVSMNHFKAKGTAEVAAKWSNGSATSSMFERTSGLLDPGIQVSSSFSTTPPPSISETKVTKKSEIGNFKLFEEKLDSSRPFTRENDSFACSGSTVVQQSDKSSHPIPSMSSWSPEQLQTQPSYSTGSLGRFKIGFTKSTTADQKNTQITTNSALVEPKSPVTSASAFSSALDVSEKGLFINTLSPPFESKSSAPSSFSAVPSNSEANVIAKQDVLQHQEFVQSTPKFLSTLSTSQSNLSSVPLSSTIVKSPMSPSHPPVAPHDSKVDGISQKQTSDSSIPSEDVKILPSALQPGSAISTFDLNLGVSASSTELLTKPRFGTQIDLDDPLKHWSGATTVVNSEQPYTSEALSSDVNVGSVKNVVSDASHEEEMEEEAPEANQTTEFTLGNLGGFGIGSTSSSTTERPNPFGVAILNKDAASSTPPFMMSPPTGEMFRPASFNFQSPQAPEPSKPAATVSFASGFSTGNSGQISAVSGFGQPANMGAGQQALGSVLGAFGQSRQLGTGLAGSNVASPNGFGGGFTGTSAGGFGSGFSNAAMSGGFASLATGTGGFAAAGAGGGFAAAATSGGGFAAATSAGSGFASSAPAGRGFGAFSSQQGGGAFSAFGSGSGTGRPPSELFTQMRR